MIDLLLVPIFAAHLLFVNIAMAGPFICVWLEWRETRRDDPVAGGVGLRLARDVVRALLAAAVLGSIMVAIIWFRVDEAYVRASQMLPPGRLWFAIAEVVFSLVCLVAYWLLWNKLRTHRGWHRLLAVLGATNLMYHFPPLFSAISVLANQPSQWDTQLTRKELYSWLTDPVVLSRVVHVWLASFAVVGTLLLVYALQFHRQRRLKNKPPGVPFERLVAWGAWLALVPTLLQLPVGMWVLFQMPDGQRNLVIGSDLLTTILFAAGVLSALRLMHQLAAVALGERELKPIVGAVAMMITTVVLMTGTLHLLRMRANEVRGVTSHPSKSFVKGL